MENQPRTTTDLFNACAGKEVVTDNQSRGIPSFIRRTLDSSIKRELVYSFASVANVSANIAQDIFTRHEIESQSDQRYWVDVCVDAQVCEPVFQMNFGDVETSEDVHAMLIHLYEVLIRFGYEITFLRQNEKWFVDVETIPLADSLEEQMTTLLDSKITTLLCHLQLILTARDAQFAVDPAIIREIKEAQYEKPSNRFISDVCTYSILNATEGFLRYAAHILDKIIVIENGSNTNEAIQLDRSYETIGNSNGVLSDPIDQYQYGAPDAPHQELNQDFFKNYFGNPSDV